MRVQSLSDRPYHRRKARRSDRPVEPGVELLRLKHFQRPEHRRLDCGAGRDRSTISPAKGSLVGSLRMGRAGTESQNADRNGNNRRFAHQSSRRGGRSTGVDRSWHSTIERLRGELPLWRMRIRRRRTKLARRQHALRRRQGQWAGP